MFLPAPVVASARANAARYPWAAALRQAVLEAAQPWLAMTYEQLWELMFGATLTRSWMVWSSGFCPACRQGVPMYRWQIDFFAHPWKVRCPCCGLFFPTNDFHAFYRSGLDERGVFAPERADRALLFNVDHPDPADPQHGFGVDDGNGYAEGDRRWRFIGTYLVYGQWKQGIVAGVTRLAAAYTFSGEPEYARRALLLLDRVADLYPTFDFRTQAIMYEGPADAGYVSTWHDACEEVRQLALAYDQVRDAFAEDAALVAFLAAQARRCGLDNPKTALADVHRNIRERILADTIANAWKIRSNYPRQIIALIVLKAVLDWPANRAEVEGMIDAMLAQATAVDGVTGEKGLAAYSSYTIQGLAWFLAAWERALPGSLAQWLQRQPRLAQTYRFHIDTWCSAGGDPPVRYYPQSGDTGGFALPVAEYAGMRLPRPRLAGQAVSASAPTEPSAYGLLLRLSELTGDPAFAQLAALANGGTAAGLPDDPFDPDPQTFQQRLDRIVRAHGTEPQVASVNKQQWHLAILRAGSGRHARAVWLDYDAGGAHAHFDGLNLGLFAGGLDLMPDLGYPPVQYGGWRGPRFSWYRSTAAHNTVVVDGADQQPGDGRTLLWGAGQGIALVQAEATAAAGCRQYERTVALVDLNAEESYVIDLFRVVGGVDHALFRHSHFGRLAAPGLRLVPAPEYGHGTQMRDFQRLVGGDGDAALAPGWQVEWQVEDRHRLLAADARVRLRCTDLTHGAEAYTAAGWVSLGGASGNEETWIPRLMVRRQAAAPPLASTFVGLLEPYASSPPIAAARRLSVYSRSAGSFPDSNVALEILLRDGCRDLFLAVDPQNPPELRRCLAIQPEWGLRTDARACWVRLDAQGQVRGLAVWQGRRLCMASLRFELETRVGFAQASCAGSQARLVAGDGALKAARSAPASGGP